TLVFFSLGFLMTFSLVQEKTRPPEGMKDPVLKREVVMLIQKWSVSKKWTQRVEDAYIESTEWEDLLENEKVIGRQILCVVITKQSKMCQWKEFLVRQDFNGSRYGKSYVFGELPGVYKTSCH